jgi:hypothetical protein
MSQWRKLPILFRKRGSCSLISHILKVYIIFVLYPMLMCFVYLICVKTLREYVDGFSLSFTVSEINERGYNFVFNFHTILMQMTKYSFVWVIYESKQKISHFLYGKEATRDQNSELSIFWRYAQLLFSTMILMRFFFRRICCDNDFR